MESNRVDLPIPGSPPTKVTGSTASDIRCTRGGWSSTTSSTTAFQAPQEGQRPAHFTAWAPHCWQMNTALSFIVIQPSWDMGHATCPLSLVACHLSLVPALSGTGEQLPRVLLHVLDEGLHFP